MIVRAPSGARGLKLIRVYVRHIRVNVAPLRGAWIETR